MEASQKTRMGVRRTQGICGKDEMRCSLLPAFISHLVHLPSFSSLLWQHGCDSRRQTQHCVGQFGSASISHHNLAQQPGNTGSAWGDREDHGHLLGRRSSRQDCLRWGILHARGPRRQEKWEPSVTGAINLPSHIKSAVKDI